MKFIIIGALAYFFCVQAFAQKISPRGINGWAGAGYVSFDIDKPDDQKLDIDDGVFAAVGGEKAFGALNMYLTINLNYLKADGSSVYNYTSNTGVNYNSGTNAVPFDMSMFQAGLGLKIKLIDNYWFRPYIEGGGLAGYFQIKYHNLSTNLTTMPDSSFRNSDSIVDFGYYGEAGVEISFSDAFGVKVAARQTVNKTKSFETLEDKRIDYTSQVFFFTLMSAY